MLSNIALLAGFAFFFSLVSGRISSTVLTGPMIFVSVGLLIGPWGLHLLDLNMDMYGVRSFADWTLAIILFTDAAEADRSALVSKIRLPERMLLIGLPLSMLFGTLAGLVIFPHRDLYTVILIAVCLAATDAALGKETLHDKDVPTYLRTGLNVESGLNDGLTVPALLVFIGLALAEPSEGLGTLGAGEVAVILLREVGVGLAVGLMVVACGVFLMKLAARSGWVDPEWSQISVVALALCAFALSQALEGSGYIAAFTGGLVFRQMERQAARRMMFSATEIGATLSLLVWVFFGTVMLEWILPVFEWSMLLYGFLSLTVIRVLAILIALTGSGETWSAKIYLGWFGPRGLASLVFVVIAKQAGVPQADFLAGVVFTTVLLSIFVHGLTTHLLSRLLARGDRMVCKQET